MIAERTRLLKYVWVALICVVLGTLFFVFIQYSETGSIPDLRDQTAMVFKAIISTVVVGLIIVFADQTLDRLIDWRKAFMLRFISGLGFHLIVVVLFFSLLAKFWLYTNTEVTLKIIIIFTITVFIYEIFYGVFYSYRSFAIYQAEQLRSDRWQLELQFESLKSQISPHYLFNCLNTVSSLLFKDTQIAEEFIRRMADTFRYVLTHQKQRLVSLRDEIEFVKAYYFLLQVRYEYHLRMEINIPANLLETKVPPMTLQLLVENAVKHNLISKDQPLLVYLSARDNTHLIVQNTKTSAITTASGFRVGLENIRQRYSFFTAERVLIHDGEKFVVQLPVLNVPAS